MLRCQQFVERGVCAGVNIFRQILYEEGYSFEHHVIRNAAKDIYARSIACQQGVAELIADLD